jgi:hypothetical protein
VRLASRTAIVALFALLVIGCAAKRSTPDPDFTGRWATMYDARHCKWSVSPNLCASGSALLCFDGWGDLASAVESATAINTRPDCVAGGQTMRCLKDYCVPAEHDQPASVFDN